MIHELLLASQSVQALGTLLKAAKGLANYNEIVAAVAEVHSKLMQANTVALSSQEKQAALAARVAELEAELAFLRNWETTAESYEPVQVARGVYAYLPKRRDGKYESMVKLCSNCFEQKRKSILQQQKVDVGRRLSLVCNRCNSTVIFGHYADHA